MTNRLTRLLKYSICAVLLAGTALAADSDSLRLIPSGTGVVIGINLEQIRASKFGQMIFAQVESQAKANNDPSAAVALDFVRGIREILVAAPSGGQKGRGLILVAGTFDATPLVGIAKMAGLTESTVQGVTVYTKEQDQPFSVALAEPSLIIAGDSPSVKAALASRAAASSGLDPAVAAKLRAVRASHHFWILTTAPLADLMHSAPQGAFGGALQGDAVKSIQQISGGLTFGPKVLVSFEVVTLTEKDATGMADGLKMLIGLATSGDGAKQLAPLLQTLDLRADGNIMKLSLSIPEEDLIKLVQSGMQGKKEPPAPPKPE
jgi:hypothetical protein